MDGQVFGRVIGQVRRRGDLSSAAALLGEGALRPAFASGCRWKAHLGGRLAEAAGRDPRFAGGSLPRTREVKAAPVPMRNPRRAYDASRGASRVNFMA